MKNIRLNDEYPWCCDNEYIEISDEIYEVFKEFSRIEHRQLEKIRYHKAFYSLDMLNGIEIDVITNRISMEEMLEQEEIKIVLLNTIHKLSSKQANRIIKRYYENMSIVSIARIENVDESSVRDSIKRGLLKLKKYLENFELM
jgi:RNA polymerase sigma-70 factor (ECF subfamily)